MASKPVLYMNPNSSHSRIAMLFAELSKIDLEYNVVDLAKRGNREEAYLKINPAGQVPALIDGDTIVYESGAIVRYLGQKYNSALYPKGDLKALGAVETAYEHIRQKPWDAGSIWVWESVIKEAIFHTKGDADRAAMELPKLTKALDFISQNFFKSSEYHLVGTQYSLADTTLAVHLAFILIASYNIDQHPKLKVFYDNISKTAEFQRIHKSWFEFTAAIQSKKV